MALLAWLQRFAWWAFLVSFLGLAGCLVDGNRILTLTVGTTISLEDEAKPDSSGATHYHVGLDDDGRSLLDKLIGPPAPTDAKTEPATAVEGP